MKFIFYFLLRIQLEPFVLERKAPVGFIEHLKPLPQVPDFQEWDRYRHLPLMEQDQATATVLWSEHQLALRGTKGTSEEGQPHHHQRWLDEWRKRTKQYRECTIRHRLCYHVTMLQCYTNFLYKPEQCQLSPWQKAKTSFRNMKSFSKKAKRSGYWNVFTKV